MPVLSSSSLKRWPERGARLQSDAGNSCTVSFADSSDGICEFIYTIDTQKWLIVNIRKNAEGLEKFSGSYRYDLAGDTLPVLTKISLRGDTSLAFGGYRFFNIRVNEALSDTLFAASIRARPDRFLRANPATASVLYDVRGRLLNNGRRAGAHVRIERCGNRARINVEIGDLRRGRGFGHISE